MNVPGENAKKAFEWVKSFEEFDNDDTSIQYDVWSGWYIQVRRGECSQDHISTMSRRGWALFHTPVWALEWNEKP